MRCRLVSDDYWSWRDRLASANDPKFWPIEAIDSLVLSGRGQFWCDGKSALVTLINEYPGGAVALEAVAGAGEMASLTGPIASDVEAWAKEQGMTHLLIAGRPGWARVHRGWKHYQSVLIKELGDG
jgi:hypothetical protein